MPPKKPQAYTGKPRPRGTTGLFAAPMRDIMSHVAKPAIRKKGQAYAKLLLNWPEIAGNDLASRCTPHKLNFPRDKQIQGTLTLAVSSSRALELQHMTPVLIEKIAIYFGYRVVAKITLLQRTMPSKNTPKNSPSRPLMRYNKPSAPCVPLPESLSPALRDALENLQKTINELD